MTDPTHTLWLQTFLVLMVLGAGLMLHLKWHPLREEFSEAWDMLQSLRWIVPMMAALLLLSGEIGPWGISLRDAGANGHTAWAYLLIQLPVAAQEMAAFMHGFFPPWPMALAVPFLLTLLMWRVKKFPYRYDSRRKRPAVFWALIIAALSAWGWLALEISSGLRLMPEWLETLRVTFRWLAEACMMAGLQIYMMRLVIGWEEPTEPEDEKDLWLALEHTLARWKGVVVLVALDLLWLLAWRSLGSGSTDWSLWVMVESSLLFAAVPVVVARLRAPLHVMLEVTAHVFMKTLWPLLGYAVSATALLMWAHFALRGVASWFPEGALGQGMIRILSALVLATVRSWLFLAFVLTLLRHGLKAASSHGQAN
ncbi:hypothetical protein [Prosthecobacter dejongeii]|uniref:Uncharacterized protein n=1 Tax=Prosthecobacter dejongeii TaxID=48465 RepID=A0A7W7YJS7_9BACT|nr:hypothetical protein [Prosthecobacter dejongeii]MBB5037317.1 hypothetical protein [Prosthecobacter dejongeii]